MEEAHPKISQQIDYMAVAESNGRQNFHLFIDILKYIETFSFSYIRLNDTTLVHISK